MSEPHQDPGYVATLVAMARERGDDPRVFPGYRLAHPECYVCGKNNGPRYFCCEPPHGDEEVAPGVPVLRCGRCRAEHDKTIHGREPKEVTCAGRCRKSLGVCAPFSAGASRPWCGECELPHWMLP